MFLQYPIYNAIQKFKAQVESQVVVWLEEGLQQLGVTRLNKSLLDQINCDLGLPYADSRQWATQFKERFSKMIKNEDHEVKSLEELFMWAQTYIRDVPQPAKKFLLLHQVVEFVKRKMREYFINERDQLIQIQVIWKTKDKCPHCLCSKSQMGGVYSKVVQCRICDNNYHETCMKLKKETKTFMCPECVLLRMDPLNNIVDKLCEPVPFKPTAHASQKTFTFKGEVVGQYAVEIRCIKIDGELGSQEQTWIDHGDIKLNDRLLHEFKPLSKNSSLKKRRDEKITTREIKFNGENVIRIREAPKQKDNEEFKVQYHQTYYLGVFLVKQLTPNQLLENIVNDPKNWLSIEDSREAIELYMRKIQTADLEVSQLKTPILCFFDQTLIVTPVRGILCDHPQCFSLENQITMMYKVTPRRWCCPICKVRCYEVIIDSYQMQIARLIRKYDLPITEISFNERGHVDNPELAALMQTEEALQSIPPHGLKNNNQFYYLQELRETVKTQQKAPTPKEELIIRKVQELMMIDSLIPMFFINKKIILLVMIYLYFT